MRLSRYLSLLLLVCVCLSVLFSPSCIAYGATPTYSLYYGNLYRSSSTGAYLGTLWDSTCNPAELPSVPQAVNVTNYYYYNYILADHFFLSKNDAIIASEGKSVTLNINNIVSKAQGYNGSTLVRDSYIVLSRLDSVVVRVTAWDADSNYFSFGSESCSLKNNNDGTYSFSFKLDSAPCDITKIDIEIRYKFQEAFSGGDSTKSWASCSRIDHVFGFSSKSMVNLYLNEPDTSGFLKTIIEGIKSIGQSVIELPTKIWDKMSDGLKGLFVPTADDITAIKNDWDNLLSDRFGCLYQVIQLIDNYADSFNSPEQQNTITLPELRLPFGDSDFVFGGKDVQIVPDRFSFMIDIIKTIISIIATCFFVNGLRNKFERLVGGQE